MLFFCGLPCVFFKGFQKENQNFFEKKSTRKSTKKDTKFSKNLAGLFGGGPGF